jgi:16S rRNA processing protein RimM
MNDEQKILIGIITGAHGIGGLVKVESLSDFPGRFASGNRFWLDKKGEVTVEKSSPHKGALLVKFQGIDDREAAEALYQGRLYIRREEVAPLSDGHYYHFQLVGLNVIEQGQKIGVIKEVMLSAANDIFVMEKIGGGEILIPALKAMVKKIDLKTQEMIVELPEGLE